MSKDPNLGSAVRDYLIASKLEPSAFRGRASKPRIENSFTDIMEALGLDLTDDSLADTPRRMAKMYCEEIFYGLDYDNFPSCTTVENRMKYDEMISVSCSVKSCCEHHLVPFVGIAHVAYIPKDKVLGLSKFNRVVDFFSRRPQIQERLTQQVAYSLQSILSTDDVAVLIQAKHMCVSLRGIQDENSSTTTCFVGGRFKSVTALREEWLLTTRK
jgi:GTP cyclohydrolase I